VPVSTGALSGFKTIGALLWVHHCGFNTTGTPSFVHYHRCTQWVYYHRPNTVCSLPPAHHSGFTRYYRRTTPHQLTTVGSLPPHTVGSILPVHHTGFTTTVSLPPLLHCHRRSTHSTMVHTTNGLFVSSYCVRPLCCHSTNGELPWFHYLRCDTVGLPTQWVHYRGFTTVGSLPWVHYRGFTTVGSLPWVHYLGFTTLGSLPWVH
jgi:hypothetical protein